MHKAKTQPGTDVKIFEIFSQKIVEGIDIFYQNTAKHIMQQLDHDIGFSEKRHIFAENRQKNR
jgi:hypothetical protein